MSTRRELNGESWESSSLGHEGNVIRQVTAQIAGQDARLHKGELRNAKFLIQQRVRESLLFALLICFDDALPPSIGELHRATFARAKIFRADLLPVDEGDGETVGQPRAEFLHEIERQCRAIGPLRVEKADERVEADAGQRSDAIMPDQSVKETEQAVDAIARRAATAGGEREIVTLLFEQECKHAEVGSGTHPFRAAQAIRRARLAKFLRLPASEVLYLSGQGISGFVQSRPFVGRIGFARRAEQRVAAVLEFAGDDLPGDGGAFGRNIGGAELGASQRHARICHTRHARLQITELAQVIDRHAVFPTKVQCGRADGARAKDADGFQMMNWNTQFAIADGGFAHLLGTANSLATVTADTTSALRKGDYFSIELPVDNAAAGVSKDVTVRGVRWNGTQDVMTEQVKKVTVPPAHEVFQYYANGNLQSDGFFTYAWDADSRLVSIEGSGTTRKKFLFDYDYMGRRVQKIVQETTNNGTSWTTLATTRFVYDGWNLLVEFDAAGAVMRSYAWGPDDNGALSSLGASAPVMMKAFSHSQVPVMGTFYLASDVSGNVAGLFNAANGNQAAAFEYGPFGEPLRTTGTAAEACPFRFGAKYWDSDTRLAYYGYRCFSPSMGRWLSHDPIGETGGVNLYGFVNNDPVNQQDLLGLATYSERMGAIQSAALAAAPDYDPSDSYASQMERVGGAFGRRVGYQLGSTFEGVIGLPGAVGRALIHPIQTAEALYALPGEIWHQLKCVVKDRASRWEHGDIIERGEVFNEYLGDMVGFLALGGVLKEVELLTLSREAQLATITAGTATRSSKFAVNPMRLKRSVEEAVELARQHGVEIPWDVRIIGAPISAMSRVDGSIVRAEYATLGAFGGGARITWADFLNAEGVVPVRLKTSVFLSDEAIVSTLGHEMHELNALRTIFAGSGSLSRSSVANLITAPNGRLHLEALRKEAEILNRMRKGN